MNRTFDQASIVGLIVTLSATFVGLYGQYKDPETGMVIFTSILIFIVFFYTASWVTTYFKERFLLIDLNKKKIIGINKDLNNLKDRLDIYKRLAKLELENEIKKKK